MKNHNNYCIIMAGGIGSRFWPISRNNKPKQFLDILKTGKTLIQQAFERFEFFCPPENIFIVTSDIYEEITREQLPNISKDHILLEPIRRNTAPCIAYANEKIRLVNPNANIIVAPSDHIILNEDRFRTVINNGLSFTESNDALVTIGIKPTNPNTGYGYIQFEDTDLLDNNIFKVKTFTEKPTLDLAEVFLQSGDFLWNSGIFIWNLNAVSAAFKQFLPDVYSLFAKDSSIYYNKNENEHIAKIYASCKSISIDYGIMEKADNVFVIAADFGWSDLGTWGSLFEYLHRNEHNNACDLQNVITHDTANSIINIDKNTVAVIQGLDNYIVALTDNCLLICNKSEEQKLKNIVTELKNKFGEQYI